MLMQPDNQPKQDGWAFRVEGSDAGADSAVSAARPELQPITWTGSEFLENHKSGGWYIILFGIIALVCGVIYFISRDILSVVFIAIMGVLFAVIASRKPRQLQYAIDEGGVHIGSRSYGYSEFKSFSLQHEGMIGYINLMPLRRFRPEISIYYPPDHEQQIFDTLSQRIPHEDHKETIVDKFTRLIRF